MVWGLKKMKLTLWNFLFEKVAMSMLEETIPEKMQMLEESLSVGLISNHLIMMKMTFFF